MLGGSLSQATGAVTMNCEFHRYGLFTANLIPTRPGILLLVRSRAGRIVRALNMKYRLPLTKSIILSTDLLNLREQGWRRSESTWLILLFVLVLSSPVNCPVFLPQQKSQRLLNRILSGIRVPQICHLQDCYKKHLVEQSRLKKKGV